MKALKALLVLILLLSIVAGTVYAGINRGVISPDQLAKIPLPVKFPEFRLPTHSLASQSTVLSSRLQDLSNHTSQVLGSSVQVNTETEPLHTRAFEYARYQYCQQVIKDFESKTVETSPNPSLSPSPEPTPQPE